MPNFTVFFGKTECILRDGGKNLAGVLRILCVPQSVKLGKSKKCRFNLRIRKTYSRSVDNHPFYDTMN